MRIVHTSDWHAGKVWKTKNRLGEVAAALDHLARFIETEEINLLLHSGDVFDTSVPMADAERVVFEFFKRVGRSGTKTVVIAGNHDNSARMQGWGLLAELVDVHTIARPVRPAEGGVLELTTRSGERAIVAGLPFTSMGMLLSAAEIAVTDGTAFATYDQGVRSMMQLLGASFRPDAVNLLIAHTYVDGAVLAGSERRATVGKEWATMPQALPHRAHYIGLGHIHKPQRVDSAPAPTQYAGSILQMDFDEAGQEKSFVRIEAFADKPASFDTVPYQGTTALARIQGTLPEIEAQAPALGERSYLEVTVLLDRHDPDVNSKVRRLLPNAVSVRQKYPEQEQAPREERKGLPPRDLFTLYYRQRNRGEPAEAVLAAFDALYRQAEADSRT
jgi:exonuclease SbcD